MESRYYFIKFYGSINQIHILERPTNFQIFARLFPRRRSRAIKPKNDNSCTHNSWNVNARRRRLIFSKNISSLSLYPIVVYASPVTLSANSARSINFALPRILFRCLREAFVCTTTHMPYLPPKCIMALKWSVDFNLLKTDTAHRIMDPNDEDVD